MSMDIWIQKQKKERVYPSIRSVRIRPNAYGKIPFWEPISGPSHSHRTNRTQSDYCQLIYLFIFLSIYFNNRLFPFGECRKTWEIDLYLDRRLPGQQQNVLFSLFFSIIYVHKKKKKNVFVFFLLLRGSPSYHNNKSIIPRKKKKKKKKSEIRSRCCWRRILNVCMI